MLRGRHDAGCSGGRPSAGATVTSQMVACAPASGRAVRMTTALTGMVALTAGQAAQVRRRYGGAPPGVPHIDVTVTPSGPARADGAALELAVFGDSSVAGVGVHDLEETLPVQVAQRVADGSGRAVHVVGYGRSGARTRDVLVRQVPAVRHDPDVAVLVVGTNDVTHLTPLADLAHSSAELYSALTRRGTPLVVSSLPEVRALGSLPNPLRAAAWGYAGLVGIVQGRAASQNESVHLVDVRRAVGREFIDDASTMSPDRFHPSATGYGRIADALAPTVIAVLRTPGQAD